MNIRKAKNSDKNIVLKFCKKTFSWGDYISDVWDDWILKGNLLVLTEKNTPVAICHPTITNGQVWIEGIRVNKNFRKKGYAKRLIKKSECYGKKNNCKIAKMLIATNNKKSLELAFKLNYSTDSIWDFYVIEPSKTNFNIKNKSPTPDKKVIELILSKTSSYVKSWRWLPLTKEKIISLLDEKKIFWIEKNGIIKSLCIITESNHFEKTLTITLVYGSKKPLVSLLRQIQNYAASKQIQIIHILTKLTNLPELDSLEKKLSFCLMKKQI